ncbi:probable calcium-binding protein CML10 [Lolium perenne]|uniref:probable calcium-binding protein CML10 n=1 Tax=Lolium perenne TaxID=4522 RepID=UPI0021EA2D7F|nr:probable calcium-binding protein CML10 [Lolium perenne]
MGKIKMPSLFRRKSRSPSPPPQSNDKDAAAANHSPPRSPTRTAEQEMERVFRKFDANGDGRISRPELAALFESLGHAATDDELARMMAEADADGDGFISLAEFAALNATDAAAVEEDLRLAFGVFDADGSGAISAAELARVLHGLGEKATVSQCRRMIEGVDKNGDGLISFDEFKVMMAGGGFAKIA